MEIDDIRAMTNDDLADDLKATKRALMNLRFRTATMQLANVNEIKKSRKRIARLSTVERERHFARAE